MSTVSVLFLIISVVVTWGGLAASAIALARRPEVAEYPAGGEDGDPGVTG